MGKLCSLSRHTTFMLGGKAGLECKRVKNASQRLPLLFTGAEISAVFPFNSCQIYESKHPRAFGKLVEGSVVNNFGIQLFVHFCCKFGRKLESNGAKQSSNKPERRHPHDVAPRTPRRPAAVPAHARTPRHRKTHRSEAGRHGHCAPKAIDAR
jgi:hypothetical protein